MSFIEAKQVDDTREAFMDATADLRNYIESNPEAKELFEALRNMLESRAAFERWIDPDDYDAEKVKKAIMESLPPSAPKPEALP